MRCDDKGLKKTAIQVKWKEHPHSIYLHFPPRILCLSLWDLHCIKCFPYLATNLCYKMNNWSFVWYYTLWCQVNLVVLDVFSDKKTSCPNPKHRRSSELSSLRRWRKLSEIDLVKSKATMVETMLKPLVHLFWHTLATILFLIQHWIT